MFQSTHPYGVLICVSVTMIRWHAQSIRILTSHLRPASLNVDTTTIAETGTMGTKFRIATVITLHITPGFPSRPYSIERTYAGEILICAKFQIGRQATSNLTEASATSAADTTPSETRWVLMFRNYSPMGTKDSCRIVGISELRFRRRSYLLACQSLRL